jgi:HEPN domain-containing protein
VNRWNDWWSQAERDLGHARNAAQTGDFEWAAFAAQQAAEKALKAVILGQGGEPWGHSVAVLFENLKGITADTVVLDRALQLDKHYLPARYPNGLPAGYPGKYYTRIEAERAIDDASAILDFCRRHLPRA